MVIAYTSIITAITTTAAAAAAAAVSIVILDFNYSVMTTKTIAVS